jgi:hypothetical protein
VEITTDVLLEGFEVSETNPMLGIASRAALLRSLGESLLSHPEIFGADGRPGMLVGKPFHLCSSRVQTIAQKVPRLHVRHDGQFVES